MNDDKRNKGLPLWSKSNFNEKYVQKPNICGTGAFSKVYLGSNIVTSAQVAIKVIDRSTLSDEEEDRLVAETEILRALSHGNILGKLRCPLCSGSGLQKSFAYPLTMISQPQPILNLNPFPVFFLLTLA